MNYVEHETKKKHNFISKLDDLSLGIYPLKEASLYFYLA